MVEIGTRLGEGGGGGKEWETNSERVEVEE